MHMHTLMHIDPHSHAHAHAQQVLTANDNDFSGEVPFKELCNCAQVEWQHVNLGHVK